MNAILLASNIALWILVLVIGVLTVGLSRHIVILHRRIGPRGGLYPVQAGLEIGEVIPNVEVSVFGRENTIRLYDVLPEHATIAFLRSDCRSCAELVDGLLRAPDIARQLGLVLIMASTDLQLTALAAILSLPIVMDDDDIVASSFNITYSPFFFVVGPDRAIVQRGVANGIDQLEILASIQLATVRPTEGVRT